MRIGILGSGLMGGKLGTIFARAGHDVVFSYSRSREKLQQLADEAGGNARLGTPADAATLIRDAGFNPVDLGPLSMARYVEPFTLLIAQIAYEGPGGPEVAYRFEWAG